MMGITEGVRDGVNSSNITLSKWYKVRVRRKVEKILLMKREEEKIVMLTAYDTATAKALDRARIDMILVGDTVAIMVHGKHSTRFADMDMLVEHIKQVKAAKPQAVTVGDMPYKSYDNPRSAVMNAKRLVLAGADVVKLEGGQEKVDIIKAVVGDGIPVMAHIGYIPQTAQRRV